MFYSLGTKDEALNNSKAQKKWNIKTIIHIKMLLQLVLHQRLTLRGWTKVCRTRNNIRLTVQFGVHIKKWYVLLWKKYFSFGVHLF